MHVTLKVLLLRTVLRCSYTSTVANSYAWHMVIDDLEEKKLRI